MAKRIAKSKEIPGLNSKEKLDALKKIEGQVKLDIMKNKISRRYHKDIVLPEMVLMYKTQGQKEAKIGKAEVDHERNTLAQMEKDVDGLRAMLGIVRDEIEKVTD